MLGSASGRPLTPRGAGRPDRAVRTTAAQDLAAVAVVVLVAGVVLAALLWRLDRGSWAVITTGSMGRSAPVGTLILTRHEPIADVVVGDVVSYHPRLHPHETITHRVVEKLPDGDVMVRGDINGATDPFPVRDGDLVGTVVVTLVGLGWLVRALPLLVVGGLVLLVATQLYVQPAWRSSVRVLSSCLLVCLSVLVLRPFVHPVLISIRTPPGGRPTADVVSGGLLPTRVEGVPGQHVDLLAGQVGSVAVAAPQPGAAFHIVGHPHLDLAWLALVGLACALPLLWCLVVGLSPVDDEE